jgi:hypothetical protein
MPGRKQKTMARNTGAVLAERSGSPGLATRTHSTLGAIVLVAALASTSLAQVRSAVPAVRILAPAPAEKAAPEGEDGDAAPADGDPAAGVAPGGVPGAGPVVPLPAEIAELKATFESLPKEQQDEMKAYYKDMGIDLDAVLGITAAKSAEAARAQEILNAMRELNFSRTPQAVLAARATLGFGQVAQPNPNTAPAPDLAKWIHLQVMAGEWQVFTDYLKGRPQEEAQRVYSAVLQSLNRGDPGLLPEELLALADASPEEPKAWQLTSLAGLLKKAAEKNGTGPLLARLEAGTRWFGGADPAARRRAVDFLSEAGMVAESYAYLPSIEDARGQEDGRLLLVHAKYQDELANKTVAGPEADAHRLQAWDLFCEVTLLPKASYETRREAVDKAVGLMNRVPRAQVAPWLRQIFASETMGPAALEVVALRAVSIGNEQLGVDERAQTVLTLKEAVDVLLEKTGADSAALRVPMRMLTAALVTEMEQAADPKNKQPQAVAREAQLLLRAIPSKAWLDALEPSLAARAGKACVGVATQADETDLALSLLNDAVKRTPDQAREIADHFLKHWEARLNPPQQMDENMYFYVFYRQYLPAAPLTRGRQHRNLDRLDLLMRTLAEINVDPRTLPNIASAFKACHARTEVYEKANIERVFGPLASIPGSTAIALAETMSASLNGDWRNRAVQRETGTKRTDSEIAELVDKGYGLALELVDSAIASEPSSWKCAVVKAGLSYDRMQFRQTAQKGGDPAKQNEYRQAAFAAFEAAASRYAEALRKGEERDDADVYERWFGAAMGTAALNFVSVDELPMEGSPQDDQVERIRKAILALPEEAAFRHMGDFARTMGDVVTRSDPEVKPRLVRHALRVIGDHPAGASLRALDELYRDLVKNEIKLRLTIDGEDAVGVGTPFGVMISLRFTNSVDRETGGFSKYLQTSVYTRVGRQYREVNYREQFQKRIETALSKSFDIQSIGFFDAFMPARGVTEEGEDGWLEKPMAYVVVTRKDPSVDRVPQMTMDMQFEDQTGPVTLVLPSNTPPLAVGDKRGERPCKELTVAQIVDVRDAQSGDKDKAIKLEVQFRGKGVVPELKDILVGIDDAVEGYTIAEKGIEERPILVLQEGDQNNSRFYWGPPKPPKGGYPEADESGIYRMNVERSWIITYLPTAGSQGTKFHPPKLKEGVEAKFESRWYSDMDVVPVENNVVYIQRAWLTVTRAGILAILVLVAGSLAYILIRRARTTGPELDSVIAIPDRVTPLSAVMTLRRIRSQHGGALGASRVADLEKEIAEIELKYFGPGGPGSGNGDLGSVLKRWAQAIRSGV